jgi:CheY-like chemotaxis protein
VNGERRAPNAERRTPSAERRTFSRNTKVALTSFLTGSIWEVTKNQAPKGQKKSKPMKAEVETPAIRVIIADDHPVVREGLTAIFGMQNDIEVVAEAADGEEACQLYDQLFPDVLMLDLRMPNKDALQAVTELMARPRLPKPKIVVMATYEGEEDINRTLKAGARSYVLKGSPPQCIRQAVRTAAEGENRLSRRESLATSRVAFGTIG